MDTFGTFVPIKNFNNMKKTEYSKFYTLYLLVFILLSGCSSDDKPGQKTGTPVEPGIFLKFTSNKSFLHYSGNNPGITDVEWGKVYGPLTPGEYNYLIHITISGANYATFNKTYLLEKPNQGKTRREYTADYYWDGTKWIHKYTFFQK